MIELSQIKITEGRYSLHNGEDEYPCSIFTYYDEEKKCLWYCVKGLYRIELTNEKKELKEGDLVVIMGVKRCIDDNGEREKDINSKEEFSEIIFSKIMKSSPDYYRTNILEQMDLDLLRYDEEKKEKEERLRLRNDNPKPHFNFKIYKGKHEYEQTEDPEEEKRVNENLDYELLTCFLYNHQLKGGVIKNNYYSQKKLTWYCFKGSDFVILTPDSIKDNTDLQYISTRRFFKSETNINTLEELESVVLQGINKENKKFEPIKVYNPNSRFDFGKYDDCTLEEVIKIDPNYINECVINIQNFIYSPTLKNFKKFEEFSLSPISNDINEKKLIENSKIYEEQHKYQRFTGIKRGSSWNISERNVFDSLTDGQYGNFDDFEGDVDRLKDGLGF
jgi:hypothetical protein